MATGSGIPQSGGIITSDVTPTYSVPHDNAIGEALGALGDQEQAIVNNQFAKHYAAQGAADGAAVAAGTKAYQATPIITNVGQARAQAFQGAYLSGIKTDIDNHIEATARDHAYDPAGFQDATKPIIAGYVKGAPGPMAAQVQEYANAKAGAHFSSLSEQKMQADQETAVNANNARYQMLNDRILGAQSSGTDMISPTFRADVIERDMLIQARVANPIYHYSPEQAALAVQANTEASQGAVLTFHASVAYHEAGGEAGLLAAKTLIDKEALSPDGAMAGLPMPQRMKAATAAFANIRDLDKADAEARQIAAQQVAAQRQADRDHVGDLRYKIAIGAAGPGDIKAEVAAGTLSSSDAGGLVNEAVAKGKSDAAMGRMADNQTRASNYAALVDMGNNGTLSRAAINSAGAGISPLQRAALIARTDTAARPIVEHITALAGGALHDAGISGERRALIQMNIAADAHTYAVNNPQATTGQQAAAAADFAKRYAGLTIQTDPIVKPAVVMTKAQYIAWDAKRYAGHGIQSDMARDYARYQLTHPTSK